MSFLKLQPEGLAKAREIEIPFKQGVAPTLQAGELLALTGVMYTGRDQTHRRMMVLLDQGEPLPVDLKGQILYYVGPTPAQPGKIIGSAGPTTSYRMDAYTPRLLELGLAATLGKGKRSALVKEAMLRHGAIYLASIAGAGALLSGSILKAEVVAFADAGTEAMYRFEVERFPAVVINDLAGRDYYEMRGGGEIRSEI